MDAKFGHFWTLPNRALFFLLGIFYWSDLLVLLGGLVKKILAKKLTRTKMTNSRSAGLLLREGKIIVGSFTALLGVKRIFSRWPWTSPLRISYLPNFFGGNEFLGLVLLGNVNSNHDMELNNRLKVTCGKCAIKWKVTEKMWPTSSRGPWQC